MSNRVIDRLGTSGWTWAEGELVVATQKPNFVALCVDPFDRSIPLDELKKMAGDGSKFNLVYQDDLAIVFRVALK